MRSLLWLFGAAAILFTVVWLAGFRLPHRPANRMTTIHGHTMGTTYRIRLAGGQVSARETRRLREAIQDLLNDINRAMSIHDPHSDVSRFNARTSPSPMAITPSMETVLGCALAIARQSGGAFDPTIAPLVNLWGFGAEGRRITPPPQEKLDAARRRVGYRELKLLPGTGIVKKQPGLQLDLGGIAKGYGVDRIAMLLEERGMAHYLVEIGGDLRVKGQAAPGRPWRVGIQRPVYLHDPAKDEPLLAVLALERGALASSGDYRNYFRAEDNTILSHIIDPRTAAPVAHNLAGVTVFAETCMLADGWATALFVLGHREGLALVEETAGLEALFILRRNDDTPRIIPSSGFKNATAYDPVNGS